MPQLYPAYGPVRKAKFLEAASARGYGKATEIIREFVPTFGIEKSDGPAKTFTVKCSQYVSTRQRATVEVEAASEQEAEKIVRAMAEDEIDWTDDHYDSEADHFQIDHIEEN
jgi:hypothetical protein